MLLCSCVIYRSYLVNLVGKKGETDLSSIVQGDFPAVCQSADWHTVHVHWKMNTITITITKRKRGGLLSRMNDKRTFNVLVSIDYLLFPRCCVVMLNYVIFLFFSSLHVVDFTQIALLWHNHFHLINLNAQLQLH